MEKKRLLSCHGRCEFAAPSVSKRLEWSKRAQCWIWGFKVPAYLFCQRQLTEVSTVSAWLLKVQWSCVVTHRSKSTKDILAHQSKYGKIGRRSAKRIQYRQHPHFLRERQQIHCLDRILPTILSHRGYAPDASLSWTPRPTTRRWVQYRLREHDKRVKHWKKIGFISQWQAMGELILLIAFAIHWLNHVFHVNLGYCSRNGEDPILKERLFGVTGHQGNHGEDVKELYYYLDSTPTHSYMKFLYLSVETTTWDS